MSISEFSSGYSKAIQLTTQTIDARAARFRNLVIGVVVISAICMVLTSFQCSWHPLLGLFLLVPLCGMYFSLDIGIVNRWQEQILFQWTQENLDLTIFSANISQIRIIPNKTLKSMISMLPTDNVAIRIENLHIEQRRALALALQAISRIQHDRTTFLVLVYTITLGFFALVLFYKSWLPLLVLFLIIPVWLIRSLTISWQFNRLIKQIIKIKQKQVINLSEYLEAFAQIDWDGIPIKRKNQLLNILSTI